MESPLLHELLHARDPATLSETEVGALFEAAVRAYSLFCDAEKPCSVLPVGHDISPTDVVRAASALLSAASLEPFELALWNSFGGLPPARRENEDQGD